LGIDRQLDSFRAVRRDIEASVLPLATSVDGRRFTFQASLYGLQLQVGSYAVLDAGGGVPRLGQVLALEMDQQPGAELTLPPGAEGAPEARTKVHIRYARGEGVIVDGDLAPFHDALIRVATETAADEHRRDGLILRDAGAGEPGDKAGLYQPGAARHRHMTSSTTTPAEPSQNVAGAPSLATAVISSSWKHESSSRSARQSSVVGDDRPRVRHRGSRPGIDQGRCKPCHCTSGTLSPSG
jgi:hypothetical protein